MKMEVHRVKTRLVNTYVMAYPDRLLVVDVAAGCEARVLGFITHELQRPVGDVALVTCTHDDPDHMGGVHLLAEATGARTALPLAAGNSWRKFLRDPASLLVRPITSVREMFRPRAREMYGNPARRIAADAEPQVSPERLAGAADTAPLKAMRLKHGARLPGFEDWRVVHTPGHSWDSLCFYHEATGSLLSGDTLLGSAPRNTLVQPAIYGNPWQLRRSLRRLRQLQVRVVYPGHGTPIVGDDVLERIEPSS